MSETQYRSGLPAYHSRFIGREYLVEELALVLAAASTRIVTLIGPGGVGKTRLAVETIRRISPTSDDDIAFIDGAMLEEPRLLLPEIADQLGIDRSDGQPVGEHLSEALAGRSLLLVLDNMEHLLPAAMDVGALLRALPQLRVLATSRAPLRIAGEQVVTVEPLGTRSNIVPAEELSAAGRLFVDRASQLGRPIELDAGSIAIVEAICSNLDGLPLAVELAAARLRIFSLPALLAAMSRQLAILSGGAADGARRHQTMRAAIEWSYDLLAADEQRLLCELGAFGDSFSLEEAQGVCIPGRDDVEELLESIYDQALLSRLDDDADGQPRFRMLSSIRDYAAEQLRTSGDEAAVRERHAIWFLESVESFVPNLHGEGQQQAVTRLDRMAPNVRHAFAYLVGIRDQTAALRMAVALQRYWRIRALWDEGRLAFRAAMALGEMEVTTLWADALRGAAIFAELRFDQAAALAFNERAISIWESLGDDAGLALSLIDYGNTNNNLGRFDTSIVAFERAAALTADGSLRTHLVARASMASALLRKGALEEADLAHRSMAAQMREIDDPSLLSTFLSNQAIVRQRLGDAGEARQILLECLEIQQRIGDDYGICVTLANLADLQLDPETTTRYAHEALERSTRIEALDVSSAAKVTLADAALWAGEVPAAAMHYLDAIDDYAQIGDELGQADVLGLIGVMIAEENPSTAARLMGAARATYTRLDVQPTSPQALRAAAVRDRVRHALGVASFDAETTSGAAWTLDEAVLEGQAVARSERSRAPSVRLEPRAQTAGNLTPRELEVLHMLADGKSDRQIAEALFITLKTANHHVARILSKLECRNRAAAVALAHQYGLV